MPEYQLHVAIALTAGLATSLGIFFLAGPEEHKNALPTFVEGDEALERDPFDVATAEDFVDGTPIDEQLFWHKVCGELLLHSNIRLATCLGMSALRNTRFAQLSRGIRVTLPIMRPVLVRSGGRRSS